MVETRIRGISAVTVLIIMGTLSACSSSAAGKDPATTVATLGTTSNYGLDDTDLEFVGQVRVIATSVVSLNIPETALVADGNAVCQILAIPGETEAVKREDLNNMRATRARSYDTSLEVATRIMVLSSNTYCPGRSDTVASAFASAEIPTTSSTRAELSFTGVPKPSLAPGPPIFDITCKVGDDYHTPFVTYQDAWAAKSEYCEAIQVSGTDFTDAQLEAVATAYGDTHDVSSLKSQYAICAEVDGYYSNLPKYGRLSASQAQEASGMLVLCPDHPQADAIRTNIEDGSN